ncbi:MAG: M24 family metallopeptidase [Candidatus Humimicrobiaceae bacterium]
MIAPPAEYKERYNRIRKMMENEGFECIIAYSNYKFQGNVSYLSSYETILGGVQSIGGTDLVNFGSSAVVVPLEGEPLLLVDLKWDAVRASKESYVKKTIGSVDFAKDISSFLKENKIKGKIGIEPWFVFPAQTFLKLKEEFPSVVFERSGIMEKSRMVKSLWEIECLREAERITDLGVQKGMEVFIEGATEREIALEAEYVMRKFGDHHLGTPSILGVGAARTEIGTPFPMDIKVKKGDILMIDIGARYKGYCGDISRAKVCGKPTPEQIKLINTTTAINKEVIKNIRPGIPASDLQKLAIKLTTEYGYKADNYMGLTGHGVGLDVHERPDYGIDETPLVENMVIAVEPCLLELGTGGVRIEDLVLVTSNGAEVLSKTPKILL